MDFTAVVIASIVLSIIILYFGIGFIISSQTINGTMDLGGKHILITGGSKGIGLSIAKILIKEESKITLVARNKIQIFSCDVTDDYQSIADVYNRACEDFGPVDILINCAGSARCGTFHELDYEDFENMNLNYFGTLKFTHVFLKNCLETTENPKTVVFVSSMAGQMGIYGYSCYSPTKFALQGLYQTLSMEYTHKNINFLIAYPPDTNTPGFENENKTKPKITSMLSETVKLYEPNVIAEGIVNSIIRRNNSVSFGLDGYLLAIGTNGANPTIKSKMFLLIEIFLSGLSRLIILIHMSKFYNIIRNSLSPNSLKEHLSSKDKNN